MASELTLSVNGAKQVVSAAPETPLIFVLRNELKLSGPRLGCGMAQCGACSVLLDGEEVRACITPISYAVGCSRKPKQPRKRLQAKTPPQSRAARTYFIKNVPPATTTQATRKKSGRD